jgi:hypothetical protein
MLGKFACILLMANYTLDMYFLLTPWAFNNAGWFLYILAASICVVINLVT